jgi:hypothetical protein
MGEALRHCADLKSVFRRHAGGWLERDSLSRVKDLCARTAASAQDPHARFEIARVAFYAEKGLMGGMGLTGQKITKIER